MPRNFSGHFFCFAINISFGRRYVPWFCFGGVAHFIIWFSWHLLSQRFIHRWEKELIEFSQRIIFWLSQNTQIKTEKICLVFLFLFLFSFLVFSYSPRRAHNEKIKIPIKNFCEILCYPWEKRWRSYLNSCMPKP